MDNDTPKYTLSDLRFSCDQAMLMRARGLLQEGRFIEHEIAARGGARGLVMGSGKNTYRVYVSSRDYLRGDCDCYMGQKDELCKHMVALALFILRAHQLVNEDYSQDISEEAKSITPKQMISKGLRKIKYWQGPSKNWFPYQDSLSTGASMIREGISGLERNKQNVKYLLGLVKKISDKLMHGVDDSDGAVWPVVEEIIAEVLDYAKNKQDIFKELQKWADWDSGFGFEDPIKAFVEKT